MISAIRNKFGSKLLDFFIFLSFIVFVGLYFIPGANGDQKNSDWALTVNNEVLSYSEFRQILENQQKANPKNQLSKKELVEQLVENLLINSLANHLNLVFKPEMLAAKIQKILPGVVDQDGRVSPAKIKAQLMQLNLPSEEVDSIVTMIFKEINHDLNHKVIGQIITSGVYLPRFILNNQHNEDHALKQFTILTANYRKFYDLANVKAIDDSDLKHFFTEQNKVAKKYWTAQTRSGKAWAFKEADFQLSVNEKQLKSYYESHREVEFVKNKSKIQVRRILFDSFEKAGQIRADLANSSASFEELAKIHSLDKASALKGGLLDFFGQGDYNEDFVDAAFRLRADGEISEVVKTAEGFEIIQRVAVKPVEYKRFDDVKAQIEKTLLKQQFEKLFSINARKAIAQSVKDPADFEQFVTNKKGVLQLLSEVDANSIGNDFLKAKLFDLKQGQRSFFIKDGKGYIVALDKIVPSAEQDFLKIKAQVLNDYKKAQAVKLIEQKLAQAKFAWQNGQSAQAVAQEFGLEYEQTKLVNLAELSSLKKDLPTHLLWSLKIVAKLKTELDLNQAKPNGYLFRLEQVKLVHFDLDQAKKASFLGGLRGTYSANINRSFIDYLRKNGTIKLNTPIINV